MSVAVSAKPKKKWRRGTPRAAHWNNPDHPFAMKLPDGRTLMVEIPGRWVTTDRDGSTAFLPDAVHFLDRVQALAMSALDRTPSPSYLTALREGLGLTQAELGERIGVDKMTISRWERGTLHPNLENLSKVEAVRKAALTGGVTLGETARPNRRGKSGKAGA